MVILRLVRRPGAEVYNDEFDLRKTYDAVLREALGFQCLLSTVLTD